MRSADANCTCITSQTIANGTRVSQVKRSRMARASQVKRSRMARASQVKRSRMARASQVKRSRMARGKLRSSNKAGNTFDAMQLWRGEGQNRNPEARAGPYLVSHLDACLSVPCIPRTSTHVCPCLVSHLGACLSVPCIPPRRMSVRTLYPTSTHVCPTALLIRSRNFARRHAGVFRLFNFRVCLSPNFSLLTSCFSVL
jgi:hypothetical protein